MTSDDSSTNVGLRLTLANLISHVRKGPGDCFIAAELIRGALADLPSGMKGSRFRVEYDLAACLACIAVVDAAPRFRH